MLQVNCITFQGYIKWDTLYSGEDLYFKTNLIKVHYLVFIHSERSSEQYIVITNKNIYI